MTATPPRPSGKTKSARQTILAERERRRKERLSQRRKSQCRIATIVEQVALARGVEWTHLFSPERCCDATSAARVLAMGLCATLDVPQFLVARAFSRNWATVYSAEVRCSTLYRKSPTFRTEWDAIVKACGETENR